MDGDFGQAVKSFCGESIPSRSFDLSYRRITSYSCNQSSKHKTSSLYNHFVRNSGAKGEIGSVLGCGTVSADTAQLAVIQSLAAHRTPFWHAQEGRAAEVVMN